MPSTKGRIDTRHGKPINWDWDFINSLSDEVDCPYLLSEREVAALLTFIDYMGWKTRWISPTDQPISLDFIEGLRDGIAYKLMREDDCPSDPCEDGCIEYEPNAGFITYTPNDPYRTPDYRPIGYIVPPWYTNPAVALPGVRPTDAMVNFLAIPVDFNAIATGFPRMRFGWNGTGEIEIEFVKVPLGGLALIVIDDNLTTMQFLDLTSISVSAVLSIGFVLGAIGIETDAQAITTAVWEYDEINPGPHHIDVTFLPNVNTIDELVLGFGGGIRKVTLCGNQIGADMPTIAFQFTSDCALQVSYNGGIDFMPVPGWDTFAADCFTGPVGADGRAGEDGAAGPVGADGAAGPAGPAGADGIDNTQNAMRCRAANAISNGFIDDILNPVLLAIVLGYANSETAEGLKTLALDKWFTSTLTATQDSAFDTAMALTDVLNDPDGAIEIYRSAIVDTAFRAEIQQGFYCWLCDDGGVALDDWPAMASAIDNLHPGEGTYNLFVVWMNLAMTFFHDDLLKLMSDNLFKGGCLDCSTMDCIDWDGALTGWQQVFEFNLTADYWFPFTGDGSTTVYVFGSGFEPNQTTNFKNISASSDTSALLNLDWVEIGLNAPYPDAVRIQVFARRQSDGLEVEYNEIHPAGTDFVAVPFGTGVVYDRVRIEIRTQGIDEPVSPTPALRYVVLKGRNPNPFI